MNALWKVKNTLMTLLWNMFGYLQLIFLNCTQTTTRTVNPRGLNDSTISYLFKAWPMNYSYTKSYHLSNAFTLPRSFLLFLQLIRTWVLFLTDCVSTERGPVLNSSCSRAAISSGVISDLGFIALHNKNKAIEL